jgi:hypothetical protein
MILTCPLSTSSSECFNRDSETLGGGSAKIEILSKMRIKACTRKEGQIDRLELPGLRIRDQKTRKEHSTGEAREGEHYRHRQRRAEDQDPAQDESRMPQVRPHGSLLLARANSRRGRVVNSVLPMRKLRSHLARDFIEP